MSNRLYCHLKYEEFKQSKINKKTEKPHEVKISVSEHLIDHKKQDIASDESRTLEVSDDKKK